MKKLVVVLVVVSIAMLFISGCGKKEPSIDEKLKIEAALVIPFSAPYTGNHTTTKISPPDTLAGVKFITYESDGGVCYSPVKNISYEKYLDIKDQMIELYGQPSRTYGDKFEWITQDSDFEVKIVYKTEIYNSMALRVKHK